MRTAPTATEIKTATGPAGRRLLGHLHELQTDPIGLFTRAARDHGDVVRLRLGPHVVHLVNHPDNIKRILQENHTNYRKGVGYEQMRLLVGNGLVANDGESWLRNRRLAQPAFHRQKIESFAQRIAAHTARMLDRWQVSGGATFDLTSEISELVYTVVGDVLYSSDLARDAAAEASQAIRTSIDLIYERVGGILPLPLWVPTPSNVKLSRALRSLRGIVERLIATRRKSGARRDDLLGMLLEARDEQTSEGMSDTQLRDELMNFTEAALDTTTAALLWTFYLLSHNPAVDARLHREVHDAIGSRVPAVSDLPALRYVSQVIDESMRLFPPGWVLGRAAIEEDVVGGYRIPAGSTVFVCPFVAHRDPRFWENPEGFDPERFSPEKVAARPRFAYFPFGGGPRVCIGDQLARMQMQIVVAMIAQRHRLDLAPGLRIGLAPKMTLVPRNRVQVSAHPRRLVALVPADRTAGSPVARPA